MDNVLETGLWRVKTTVEKYNSRADMENGLLADKQVTFGNLLLKEGVNLLWNRLIGGATLDTTFPPFSNANANIGVGDDNTAPDRELDTGLKGTNTAYKPMDTGYPQVTGSKVVFRSTFDGTAANFDWKEWSVCNSATQSTGINLNRKVEPMGTKVSGAVWIITVEITLS